MKNLILGDCLEFLEKNKNFADLIVTDPPYKWNKTTGGRAKNDPFASKWRGKLKNDDNIIKASLKYNSIKFSEWLPAAYHCLKSPAHCYVFTNDKNLQDALNAASTSGFRLHNVLVWKKNNCTPNRWYMKNIEFILFLYKGKAFPINNLGSKQHLDYGNIPGNKKLHPTEKPVELLKEIILNSSQPGQIIVDPFMGSGSTGFAALDLGRKFVGLEIDSSYFTVAAERLENFQ
jgi:site-specific DNA-methyltransferase (adenine-specific)